MRPILLGVVLASAVLGCAPVAPLEPRCVALDAELCDAAWQLAQSHLQPGDGAIQDAVVGRAGGAATCHPVPCPESIAATVYYPSGVLQEVNLQVTGGLRVTDARRVVLASPPPDGGKPEQAP